MAVTEEQMKVIESYFFTYKTPFYGHGVPVDRFRYFKWIPFEQCLLFVPSRSLFDEITDEDGKAWLMQKYIELLEAGNPNIVMKVDMPTDYEESGEIPERGEYLPIEFVTVK